MKRLAARHLQTHGLTREEYIAAFEGGLRICTQCKRSMPATEEFFYKKTAGTSLSLSAACRDCTKAAVLVTTRARDRALASQHTEECAVIADQPGAVVQCLECNRWFDSISNTHLAAAHGMTVEQYRLKHPDAFLQSDATKGRAVEGHGYDEDFRKKRGVHMKALWQSPESAPLRAHAIKQAKVALLQGRETRGIATYRTTVVPTELHGAIIGMVLGDSGLPGRKSYSHAHLSLGHCESQLPYLQWKVGLLGSLIASPIAGPYIHAKKPAEPFYKARTIAHPYFSWLHDRLYGERGFSWLDRQTYKMGGKRFITPDALEPLDALGLALWYQDDGSLSHDKKNGTVNARIATNSFAAPSVDYLIEFLAKRFSIQATKHRARPGQFTLYIRRSSHDRFFSLVAPHVHPCMAYKLPSGSP